MARQFTQISPLCSCLLTFSMCRPENLRRSVETINAKLGGIKKMDLFEPARVPDNVSLEDAIKTLGELKNEGHFSYLGMSECSAATLKRAHAVRHHAQCTSGDS